MNLDTRARRAADGVRASAQGVDPMAQITELKHEARTRRRTASTMAVLGAAVVVAGAGWFATSQLGDSDAGPAEPVSTPSPTVSAFTLESGRTVGARLEPRLVAKAPDSWFVQADGRPVLMLARADAAGARILIAGPVLSVYDPDKDTGVDIPADGYANWLREHPYLTVLADRMVLIDGRQFSQLTLRVDDDTPGVHGYPGVRLGKFVGIYAWDQDGWPWDQVLWGTEFTETVIEVDGQTMVLKSLGARNGLEQAQLEAAVDLVLSTMKLPR